MTAKLAGEPEPPGRLLGVCLTCGKPVRSTHGWVKDGGALKHIVGSCDRYQRDDACNLLARIRWAMDEGHDQIPDIAHAIHDEITEMIG